MIFQNCCSALSIPAAVQRRHMSALCQRFTFLEVRLRMLITDSIALVDCNVVRRLPVIFSRPRAPA